MNITLKAFLKRENGSEIAEFGIVLLAMMAFAFLIVDIAWAIFAQASLQYAAREGVRYAVTGQTLSGAGQDASIKSVVENHSFGFLTAQDGSKIAINYYTPDTQSATKNNYGGNLVEVMISGVQVSPLGPVMRDSTSLMLTARSSDVMESSPGGIPPLR